MKIKAVEKRSLFLGIEQAKQLLKLCNQNIKINGEEYYIAKIKLLNGDLYEVVVVSSREIELELTEGKE